MRLKYITNTKAEEGEAVLARQGKNELKESRQFCAFQTVVFVGGSFLNPVGRQPP